jgi:hypothetical protein
MKPNFCQALLNTVLASFLLLSFHLEAQNDIENLLVETYYVSDANDATDQDGGGLPEGSITYRVFLDLAPNVKLLEIFSNENHEWIVRSSELIWNNLDRGEVLGSEIGDNRLDENTVALDSYITFGAASDAHYGIPKDLDVDGSIVGGVNNDGGSEGVEGGLLTNSTNEMGLALTVADGLIQVEEDLIQSPQTSLTPILTEVFESETNDSVYVTSSERLQLPIPTQPISGPTPENLVMIAQITTLGEIEFKFNVRLVKPNGQVVTYVAENPVGNELVSPFLTFPPECGCTDPDFLEFDPAAPCDDGSCATLIEFGCTDPEACNFNPDANFNIPELCCYGVDDCNNLDWTLICPSLDMENLDFGFDFEVFPNPVHDQAWVKITSAGSQDFSIEVLSLDGQVLKTVQTPVSPGEQAIKVDLSGMAQGIYVIKLNDGLIRRTSLLIKQ